VDTAKQSVGRASEGPKQARKEIAFLMEQYRLSPAGTWSGQRGIAVICSSFPQNDVAKEYVELLLFYADHGEAEAAYKVGEYKVKLKNGETQTVVSWLDSTGMPASRIPYHIAWQRAGIKLKETASTHVFQELD